MKNFPLRKKIFWIFKYKKHLICVLFTLKKETSLLFILFFHVIKQGNIILNCIYLRPESIGV